MKLFSLTCTILLAAVSWLPAQPITITQIRIENMDAEQADVSTVSAYSSFSV